ncbi:hypothetical protein [Porcipelethomonas sp.]|uniref:hypothetical protein n=1 Tax=Porcipelethomonas sp. TaxID=2981675 RepID=UPI003EF205B6
MVWIILAIILLIILILFLSPVRIYVNYENGKTDIYIKYLFWKKRTGKKKTSDSGKKEKREGRETEKFHKKSDKKSQKNKLIPEKTEDKIEFVLNVLKSGGKSLKCVMKRICIYDIFVDFTISDMDAYDCALKFGKTNIVVYNIFSYLGYFVKLKKKSINIKCIYNQPECIYNFSFIVKFTPASGLLSAFVFILTFLVNNNKNKKAKSD